MSEITFNREIKRMIANENHLVLKYISEKFQNSRQHQNYYDFFDNFLFDYGILTLGYSPILNGNKYAQVIFFE